MFELHEKSQLFEMEIIEWKNHKNHKLRIGTLNELFDSSKYVGETQEEGGEKSLLQRCTVSLSLRPPLFASLVFLKLRTYRTAGLRVGVLLRLQKRHGNQHDGGWGTVYSAWVQ